MTETRKRRPAPPPSTGTVLSDARITRLPSGLTVVTDPMPTVETVSLGVWVGVGTREETPAENGAAHLLEHMVFKGTPRRSATAIAEEVEAVGGHLNAYTGRESTAYYAKVLKEDAALAIDVIADITQNALFDPDELVRERQVVQQEIGQAIDTPDDIAFDYWQQAAYPDHTLGLPVLGTAETVAGLDVDAVRGFHRRYYNAGDMVLAAAGNIDHDRLVDMAAHFDSLGDGKRTPRKPVAYRGGSHREARALEQLHLLIGFDGVGYRDPDYYAISVLSTLLGGGMSSRLFQEIRERRGLVYSIHSFTSHYCDGGLFGIYAGTGPGDAADLIPALAGEVMGVLERLPEEEIERAKAQLKASLLMGLESTTNRCEQLGTQMLVFDRLVPPGEVVEKLAAVDRAAVQSCCRRMLSTPPTITALGPLDGVESDDAIAARFRID